MPLFILFSKGKQRPHYLGNFVQWLSRASALSFLCSKVLDVSPRRISACVGLRSFSGSGFMISSSHQSGSCTSNPELVEILYESQRVVNREDIKSLHKIETSMNRVPLVFHYIASSSLLRVVSLICSREGKRESYICRL